jgi:ribosomal protein S18 acetylase RimI-like enzyme
MHLTIRSARPGDEARAIALWRECGLVVPANDPAGDFRFAVAGGPSAILIGEDETGNACGSVMVGHDGHRGWFYYVASVIRSQGQGVGRQMMQAAEAWLSDRGIWKAQLLVRDTNTAVIAFYERLGFEVAPRVVMTKRLDQPGG